MNKWFDTSGYDKKLDRPLTTGINKKVIGRFNDELGGLVMTEIYTVRTKTYAFKDDNNKKEKKEKGTKKCVIKKDLILEDYKRSLLKNETIRRLQLRFRSDHHKIFTEEINKVAISSNDDKTLVG